MRLNYIILAHKNPSQVERLINRLYAPEAYFYVHIDKKVDPTKFEDLLRNKPNVSILENSLRENGTWGDIGIVKATINALKLAYKKNESAYFILLSGQDYPLQKAKGIHEFFIENSGKNYITSYPLPSPSLEKGGLNRIERYKINKTHKRGHFLFLSSIFDKDFYTYTTLGKLNFLRKSGKLKESLAIFRKRKFPGYLEPYAGSQWWALTETTVAYILRFIDKNPGYLKYHTYSLLPDEMFFQSIIKSASNKFLVEFSKTYVNWERSSGPLPVTFEQSDFEEIKDASKHYLFARKFDIQLDNKILDKIDREILT